MAAIRTVGRLVERARDRLRSAGVADPGFEARVIVADTIGSALAELPLRAGSPVEPRWAARVSRRVTRRSTGAPLQYVLGNWDFFGAGFEVRPPVLIPRPETEVLVEALLSRIDPDARGRAIDLGTGTGVIAVTLKGARPGLAVEAIDLDTRAVRLARRNARAHGVEVAVSIGDFTRPLSGSYDVMASNPPYIPTAVLPTLDPAVRDHESHLALDGGEDGLEGLRAVLARACESLLPGGVLAVEIGHDQGSAALELCERSGLGAATIERDLAGRDRVVLLGRDGP